MTLPLSTSSSHSPFDDPLVGPRHMSHGADHAHGMEHSHGGGEEGSHGSHGTWHHPSDVDQRIDLLGK